MSHRRFILLQKINEWRSTDSDTITMSYVVHEKGFAFLHVRFIRYITMAPFSDAISALVLGAPSGPIAACLPLIPIIWGWLAAGPTAAWLKPSNTDNNRV